MNPLLRDSATHLFRADISGEISLDDDAHHVEKVLRVRDGESISVSDGRGKWRLMRYVSGGRLEADSDVYNEGRSSRRTCIAFVPVKGERTEWTVEKLVEIGIDRIVVLAPTVRSVVRWDSRKNASQQERLGKTMHAAASQSRRVWLPEIEVGIGLDQMTGGAVVFADPEGAPLSDAHDTIVIGPEGGFAPEEVSGRPMVSLGATILRAETAAVVAATLMVAHLER